MARLSGMAAVAAGVDPVKLRELLVDRGILARGDVGHWDAAAEQVAEFHRTGDLDKAERLAKIYERAVTS